MTIVFGCAALVAIITSLLTVYIYDNVCVACCSHNDEDEYIKED